MSNEKTLEQNSVAKQTLMNFIHESTTGFAMFDRDMRYLACSKRYLQDYGLIEEDIIGRCHYEIFKNIPQGWIDVHQRCLNGAKETCEEDSFLNNQGELEWLSWEVRPWHEDDGKIGGIVFDAHVYTDKKNIELELKTYQHIINENIDFIALLNKDYQYVIINPAYLRFHNKTREEVIGKTPAEVFDQATFENIIKPRADECMRGNELHYASWFELSDKGRRHVDLSYAPYYDSTGALYGYIMSGRDSTDWKIATTERDQAWSQIDLVLRSAGEGIYGLDKNGHITFLNPAAEMMLGWKKEDLVNQPQHTLIHQSHVDGSRHNIQEGLIQKTLKEGLSHKTSDHVFWRKDGSPFPVEYTSTPIQENNEVTGAVVVFRDITERKSIEDILKLFEFATEHISDCVYWIKPDGSFYYVNHAACEMLGYTREELLQLSVYEIDPFISKEQWDGFFAEIKSGNAVSLESQHLTKDGRYIDIEVSANYLAGKDFEFDCAIVRDISERKRNEQQLQYSEQRYRQFTESTTSIIWTTDEHGEFIEPQPSWEKYTGQSWPEQQGFGWAKSIHPDDVERIKQEWAEALAEKRLFENQGRIWSARLQEWRNYVVNAIPIFNQDGSVREWIGEINDVSDSKRLENDLLRTKDLLYKTQEIARIGGWEYNIPENKLNWTDMTFALHEVPTSYEPTVEEALAFYQGKSAKLITTAFEAAISKGERFDVETTFKTAKGKELFVRAIGEAIYAEGQIISVAGTFEDITERKQNENAIRASESKYRTLVESSPYCIHQMDNEGVITSMNKAGLAMCGLEREEEIIGTPYLELADVVDKALVAKRLEAALQGEQQEFEYHGANNMDYQTIKVPIFDQEGHVDRVLGIALDITDSKAAQEQLNYQASHDALTDLINRREFEARTADLLAKARANKGEHALCFIDLDQFKVVNDTSGHTAGDEMLRQLSSALNRAVRKSDTLARLGGDEFGVLLENCPLEQAVRVAETLLEATQDFVFQWEGQNFKVGASIGLVPINIDTLDVNEVLKHADTACYMAKDLGRNRIYVYHIEDKETTQRQGEMQWVSRLNDALDNGHFCLYAQTIQPLQHDKKGHYELLIRMIGDQNTIISPGAFLPAAERFNLISKLDRWIIDRAFELLANNHFFLEKIDFCSINLSGQSLTERKTLERIMELFDKYSLSPEKICFEITETSAISNLSQAIRFISTLKGIGCRFALDDFGSGLSSFAYLKNLPVDYLKIDGMFVRDIVDDPIDHAMVKSINEIGKVMGMKTIAEFVESDIIKGMLKEIGVDYAQGYGIEKPVPFEDLLQRSNNVIELNIKKT